MGGVGMREDGRGGGCGGGERCRPKGTPLREERSGWQAGEAGNEQDGALKGRRYTEAKRDFIPRNARDGAEVSLRRPTHSQKRMRKKKSACSVRNGGNQRLSKWKMSTTTFVLRLSRTRCPPITTWAQSGGGGGSCRSSSSGQRLRGFSEPVGSVPPRASC